MTTTAPLFPDILAAAAKLDGIDPPAVTAARLARRENARLQIVHAVSSAALKKGIPHRQGASGQRRAAPSFPAIARRLADLYGNDDPGLAVTDIHITAGVAWEVIYKRAAELKSHLIVLGPHVESAKATRLPQARGPLGSTAEGVIRHVRCPVMLINQAFAYQRLDFKKIAVGIDFWRPCISALCLAALIATHFDGQIYPFHMLPIPPYPKYTPASFVADLQRIERQLDAVCRQLLQGIHYQTRIKTGVIPHKALLQHARRIDSDLIVIGSHTKEKAGKWYPGSVAQQLGVQAHCPVIVVNGPDALAHWENDPRTAKLSSIETPSLTLFPM